MKAKKEKPVVTQSACHRTVPQNHRNGWLKLTNLSVPPPSNLADTVFFVFCLFVLVSFF